MMEFKKKKITLLCGILFSLWLAIRPAQVYQSLAPSPIQTKIEIQSYPPDPTSNISWSGGTNGVNDIQSAFNHGRTQENNQLGTSIPAMVLPTQTIWDSMSDNDKALWLINQERVARGLMPLDSIEDNVKGVAQYYANYLLDNDTWGHSEDGNSPWERLDNNPAIGACHDFLPVAENLAVFVTSGNSIALPIERAIYMWLYDDAGSSWGHRHAILWYPYDDNSGLAGQEGFLGIGRANGGPYQGPFSSSWNFAELIVMNVFDPCSTWTYPTSAPEIDVQGKGVSIIDGDSNPEVADNTDFGKADVDNSAVSHTFTIENMGDGWLSLTLPISITGTHAADFTVTAQPISPVAGGGGTTAFEVAFDPSGEGLREAEISVANDDSDENPYNFAIQGTGVVVTFVDVPLDHPRWAYIQALWDGGYTAGCSTDPLMYCPDQVMNRAMSAVFMLRGQFGEEYVPPIGPWNSFGDDWSAYAWAEKWAEGMLEEGLTAGCQADPLLYCPGTELPRVQASVFGLRMMHGMAYTPPPASGTLFADMTDPDYWGTKWAEQAYLDGLLPACGDQDGKPLFCPSELVDRSWGAYLIVKAKDLPLP